MDLVTLRSQHWRRRRSPRTLALFGAISATLGILALGSSASAGWTSPGSAPSGSGRIWSVAVNPGNPLSLLLGTDNGVFSSIDGGATWSAAGLKGIRVWTVGFDVRSPYTAYAGTAGHGVATSNDDVTWKSASSGLSSLNVRSFAFSLAGVAAGTDNGVDLSTNGTSWGAIGLGGESINALTVVANSPSLVLLAGTDSGNVSHGSVFLSSGQTWSTLGTENGLRTGSFVSSMSSGPPTQASPHRSLLVTLSAAATATGTATSYPATFRSLDGGGTWEQSQGIPTQGGAGVQPIALTATAFSPLDPNVVYAGADAGGSTGGDVLRSTDGGLNFAEFKSGLPADASNVEAIAVASTSPPTVFVGVDSNKSGEHFYKVSDTAAPPPPTLLAEAPGAPIPSAAVQPTAPPLTHGTPQPPSPTPAPSGVVKVVQTVFHFPIPLVLELLALIGVAYGIVWWKQRAYIEGPPD